jgi:predicted Zn-dependent protease
LPKEKQLQTLTNLATTAIRLNSLEEADRYIDEVKRLAHPHAWAGRLYLLRTVAELRLRQNRHDEALTAIQEALSVGVRDFNTLLIAAEASFAVGSVDAASRFMTDLRRYLTNRRSRKEFAAMLIRVAELDENAGRVAAAQEHRQQASAYEAEPSEQADASEQAASSSEDRLLDQVHSVLAGRKFAALDGPDALILGMWLALFLGLAISVLLPMTLPLIIVFMQACLLLVFAFAWQPVSRWVLRPKSSLDRSE